MLISQRQKVYFGILLGILFLLAGVLAAFLFPSSPTSPQETLESYLYPSPSKSNAPSTYPAEVVDLTNWKVTVPTGGEEKPTEIKQPELDTYSLDPWFVTTQNNAIRFRAPVSAVTTKGSNYPRSELREMTNNGRTNANWSSTAGIHTMTIDQAITAVPRVKQHVVAGQIHDADDDVIVIRLENPVLYVNVDGDNVHTLDSNYSLGKRFQVKFVAENGKTSVYYNNSSQPVYTLNKAYSGAYFKAGAYTQSNCIREQALNLCNDNNYGEVVIYSVEVTHK